MRAVQAVGSRAARLDPTCKNLGRGSEWDIWCNVAECVEHGTHAAKAKDCGLLSGEIHVGILRQTKGMLAEPNCGGCRYAGRMSAVLRVPAATV